MACNGGIDSVWLALRAVALLPLLARRSTIASQRRLALSANSGAISRVVHYRFPRYRPLGEEDDKDGKKKPAGRKLAGKGVDRPERRCAPVTVRAGYAPAYLHVGSCPPASENASCGGNTFGQRLERFLLRGRRRFVHVPLHRAPIGRNRPVGEPVLCKLGRESVHDRSVGVIGVCLPQSKACANPS